MFLFDLFLKRLLILKKLFLFNYLLFIKKHLYLKLSIFENYYSFKSIHIENNNFIYIIFGFKISIIIKKMIKKDFPKVNLILF